MSLDLYIDSTLNGLEEIRFRKSNRELIWQLAKETNFTRPEVEILLIIYYKFKKQGRKRLMTKQQLAEFLHNGLDMTDEYITARMVMARCRGPSPYVTKVEWVKLFDTLLKGTRDEKISHCFVVYDMMNQGKLDRNTILGLLDGYVISEDEAEDLIKDMSELLLKLMDFDRCGKISFDDYKQSCLEKPLLLEFLGQCLPSRLAVATFFNTIKKKVKKNF